MHRGGLAAFNGDILRGRGHITVHRQLFHQIGAGQQLFLNLPVFSGSDSFIYFISQNVHAGNVERNTRHNAVLAGLDDLCDTVGFGLDLYKEGNRVAGTGHHSLVAGSAPDQHVIGNRDVLSEFKNDRVHNHVLTGERVLVPVSCDGNAAAFQSLQIDFQVIGVRDSQGIDLFLRVPFQFQLRCLAFLRGSKRGNRGMGSNLGKNPVIGFFRRTSGNHAEILVGVCMAVPVPAVRVAPKLLLVLPENDLCRHFIIVLVNAGHREGSAGFPAVDRREGDPPSCLGREQV